MVGIATRYCLDCPGIEARWRRDFPHSSKSALCLTQPHIKVVPCHSPGLKRPELGVNHPPPYNTEVKMTVELEGYKLDISFIKFQLKIIFRLLRNRAVITNILK